MRLSRQRLSLPALLHDDSVVLTIQNGLGSADRLAASISAERLLIGVAGGFGASLSGPGHAHHNGMELIRLGEMIWGERARGLKGLRRCGGMRDST
ncbi:MAG: hypothetical protein CM1200mP41_09350 [Gammaproteobacteria bacterium]|nr:MAG: hypothetical protein CM1200mP41_09350 [Gammaproteobacteria bacterium]